MPRLMKPFLVMATAGYLVGGAAGVHAFQGPALQVSSRTADAIEGAFGHGGSLVSFSSRLDQPTLARMTLDVDGLFLEATYDSEKDVLYWNGHDGALTVEARQALIALSESLEQALSVPTGAVRPLHEDLLYRRVLFWAEAPVGLPLPARTLTRPSIRFDDRAEPSGAQPLACDVGNEDGIWHFANCSTYARWMVHDASPVHCLIWESINAGPGSSDCMGRCGPGCRPPLCGWSAYTFDCGDHDRCCRVHGGCVNPWARYCGDEYFEADDDFLWAWPRCFKCL